MGNFLLSVVSYKFSQTLRKIFGRKLEIRATKGDYMSTPLHKTVIKMGFQMPKFRIVLFGRGG